MSRIPILIVGDETVAISGYLGIKYFPAVVKAHLEFDNPGHNVTILI